MRESLPHELTLLLDAFRGELDAKISSLKAWGIAMTLGGGTLGGIIAGLHPHAFDAGTAVILRVLS